MARFAVTNNVNNLGEGTKFANGHKVGSSGIPRPTKFQNKARKAANRRENLSQRSQINSAFSSSSKGAGNRNPVWHGAINGTPKAMGTVAKLSK